MEAMDNCSDAVMTSAPSNRARLVWWVAGHALGQQRQHKPVA